MLDRCTCASSMPRGQTRVHKNIEARPDYFLALISPFRENLAVAAECMFAWYWLADLCHEEKIDTGIVTPRYLHSAL